MPDDPDRPSGLRQAFDEQLLRTRQLLDGREDEAAEAVISQTDATTEAEARIAAELVDHPPLAEPDRFLAAHRRTMQALEVLDRDGAAGARVSGFGTLAPLVAYAIEQVAEYVLASYARDVIQTLRVLYARRAVQCEPETEQRALLMRAREEVALVAPDYGSGGGLVKLLIGSAVVPVVGWLAQVSGAIDLTDGYFWLAAIAAFAVLYGALAWLLRQAAALAHRRSQLIMQPPLADLWQSTGNCGAPPRDGSRRLAIIAIGLTTLVWFVLPALAIVVNVIF